MNVLYSVIPHLFSPRRSNNHRPKILKPLAYAYLTCLLVVFVFTLQFLSKHGSNFGAVLGFASTITPAQVIDQTNAQRERLGLAPLTFNKQLTDAALAKGQNMMTNQYWSHVSPDGTEPWYFIHEAGYEYRVAGENLARDFSDTSRMIEAWMASPTHKANIMNPRYTEIGIAVIDGTLEGYETTLVVQMFGQPVTPQLAENEADVLSQGVGIALAQLNETSQSDDQNLSATPIPAVLASAFVPMGSIEVPPLLTPLQIIKAVFLSLIMILGSTLIYDAWVVENSRTVRLVGKNLAHIFFLATVAFLVIFFKAGLVG